MNTTYLLSKLFIWIFELYLFFYYFFSFSFSQILLRTSIYLVTTKLFLFSSLKPTRYVVLELFHSEYRLDHILVSFFNLNTSLKKQLINKLIIIFKVNNRLICRFFLELPNFVSRQTETEIFWVNLIKFSVFLKFSFSQLKFTKII